MFVVSCILVSKVAFTILQIFLIHDSSICLTLSLVMHGEKELPIFCRVSLSEKSHTLLSITFLSFLERESSMSLKDSTIFLLLNTLVVILYFFNRYSSV
ncbi:hypothetical protein HOB94_03975 [bacterium]|nr:hypothetical protein [bacterium]MBT6779453.1 hypothetical protein [bacterium]